MQVTRRDFGRGLSALAASMVLLKDEARTPSIDLNKFCNNEPGPRYDLTKPFQQEGLAYATDARICVRVDELIPEDAGRITKLPRAADLDWCSGDWKPFIANKIKSPRDYGHWCPMCRGHRRLGDDVEWCDVCEGEGEFVKLNGGGMPPSFIPCRQCRGLGSIGGTSDCTYCEDGLVDYEYEIEGIALSPIYYELVHRELHEVQYFGTSLEGAVHLRFAGGEGLLMPLEPLGARGVARSRAN